jgi:hypothetical protein
MATKADPTPAPPKTNWRALITRERWIELAPNAIDVPVISITFYQDRIGKAGDRSGKGGGREGVCRNITA